MSTNSHGYLDDDREFAYRYGEKMECPYCETEVPFYFYDERPRCTTCRRAIDEFADPLLDELADTDVDEIVAVVIDLPEPAEVIPGPYHRAMELAIRWPPMLRRQMKARWA